MLQKQHGVCLQVGWVGRVYRPHQHIIGHFGDESFQSTAQHIHQKKPRLTDRTERAWFSRLVVCTTSGQETERVPLLPTPEPARGVFYLRDIVQSAVCWGTDIRGQPFPKVTRSLKWVKTKLEDPQVNMEVNRSLECDIFSLRCFDTVGWLTGRASGL